MSEPVLNSPGERRAREAYPWRQRNVFAITGTTATGVVGTAIAWYGSSRAANPFDQAGWLSLGTGSLTVAALGGLVWLLNARRRIGVRAHQLAIILTEHPIVDTGVLDAGVERPARVSGPGMAHFHRPTCILVISKPVASGDRRGPAGARLAPCPICEP